MAPLANTAEAFMLTLEIMSHKVLQVDLEINWAKTEILVTGAESNSNNALLVLTQTWR